MIQLTSSANADGPHADEVASLLEQDPSLVPAYTYLRSHVHTLEESVWGPTGVTDIWFISFIGVLESARGRGVGRLLCDLARDDAHGKVGLVAITAEGVSMIVKPRLILRSHSMSASGMSPRDIRSSPLGMCSRDGGQ